MEMETYTGLTGLADKFVRLFGKRFFVIETGPCELLVVETEAEVTRLIQGGDWNSWVAMIALSAKKAVALFYDAHEQWRSKYDPV